MVKVQRVASILLTLSLILSLGVLAPPAAGTAVAQANEWHVYSGDSIQWAIDDAAPGDTIIVHPGTYEEAITIEKSLTVVSSDGAAETIIDWFNYPSTSVTITLSDAETVVFGGEGTGFTVLDADIGMDVTVEYWSSVTIEGNTITNSNDAIDVSAVRYFSDLTLSGNTVDTAWYSGFYLKSDAVQYHSSLDIVGNTITNCGDYGLYSSAFGDDCHVVVQGNTIDTADYGAVHCEGVFDRSSLDIIDNEMSDCEASCIYIEYVSELSEGRIRGNTLSDNLLATYGIFINTGLDDGARLTIEDNTITGTAGYGCYIYEVKNGSYLEVLDNDLSDNTYDGLYIESLSYGCECVVRGNTIRGNDSCGVDMYGDVAYGSQLTVESNTITGNSDYGLACGDVDYGSRLDVLANEISGNPHGVYINGVAYLSEARLDGNTVSDNGVGSGYDGVYIAYVESGSRLALEDNDVQGNGACGVRIDENVYAGASVSLVDNNISDNVDSGVYISDVYDGSECVFEGNTFSGNDGSGVYISNDYGYAEDGSRFTFEDNTISENYSYGLFIGSLNTGAYLGVLENTIEDNGNEGVYVSNFIEGSECIVTDNTIDSNGYGIYVDYATDGCLLHIEDNSVTGSVAGAGIYCGYKFVESDLKVLGNTISNNAGIGLQICDWTGSWDDSFADSRATVRCNTISGNTDWGISTFIYRSLVDISGNHVTGNGEGINDGGIYVDGDYFQVVGIHQNSITGNSDWGLRNGGGHSLDATENWWGDADGPTYSANPGGQGDEVSDDVEYEDWLNSAPRLCATYQPESTTPSTITVGGDDEDYSTIQEAIDGSSTGDIILVSPGTYSEDVSINDSRTLKSTGGAGVTFIDGMVSLDVDYELSTVVFGGVDAGFTVTNGSGDGFYVDVEGWSQVTIQGNVITGCSGHGIGVSGAGVRCFSSLSILDNEITDNGSAGINLYPVKDFSSADIRRNTISGNTMDGIYLYPDSSGSVIDHGSVSIVDNDISDNIGGGIYSDNISNNSNVLVQGNTISRNGEVGFEVYDVGSGSTLDVSDNEIQDNSYAGIYWDNEIARLADARISGNTISGHADYGIYLYSGPFDGARLTVEGNAITGNGEVGFQMGQYAVMYGGYLAVLENEISNNGSYGVNIYGFIDGGEGRISGNTISGNGNDGLYIEDGVTYGAALTVQENTIEDNQGYGVDIDALESGSFLVLLDNQVNRNDSYGVYLYDCYGGSEALVQGNTFTGNAGYGVCSGEVTEGARMSIEDNAFTDNTDNACEISSVNLGSRLDLLDNEATGGLAEGFDLNGYYEGSQGVIRGNSVTGAAGDGIYVQEVDYGCALTVEQNTFSQNGDIGFDCSSGVGYGSYVEFLDNVIEDNNSDGLYIYDITDGAAVAIRGTTVSGNDEGITIEEMYTGGLLTVEDNEVSENNSIGLWLCGTADTLADSEAAVWGNIISGNSDWGIESNVNHAMLDISGCNKVQDNWQGIHLFGSDLHLVHINNNNIAGNVEGGLSNTSFWLVDATRNWWGDISGPENPATNPDGLGDFVSYDVTFEPWLTQTCDPSNVAAAFRPSRYTCRPGDTISFTDLSTTGCEIIRWLWDFGDGSTSTEQNPSHTYMSVGQYTVTLTVWDACGYSDTVVKRGLIGVRTPLTVAPSKGAEAPEPADLGLSNLVVNPAQVLPNQPVVVSANICNSGEERGSKTVSLMLNGEAVDSQTVGVSGGACQTVTFTVARAVPGTYQVAVDGMAGQFSVLAPRTVTQNVPSQQQNGVGTAGIIAIIAVMLVLIGALVVVFRR